MYEELLPAIRERQLWLSKFRAHTYPNAFRAYAERFGPLYGAAVRQRDEEELSALAEGLLDQLAEGWRRCRIWGRGARRAEEKQMVVIYLTPMLLESPEGSRLAELLRAAWLRRWPKDRYEIATCEEIQGGFRNAIFGIELRR